MNTGIRFHGSQTIHGHHVPSVQPITSGRMKASSNHEDVGGRLKPLISVGYFGIFFFTAKGFQILPIGNYSTILLTYHEYIDFTSFPARKVAIQEGISQVESCVFLQEIKNALLFFLSFFFFFLRT